MRTGSPQFTYVRLDGHTVTALVMFVHVQPLKELLCFQLGVAVPEKYRAQGRAKEIVTAATAELQNGLNLTESHSRHVVCFRVAPPSVASGSGIQWLHACVHVAG